ncbi:thiamine pyrophosphate-binding protein [Roseibacterium sp. SDUM158016]|uniref:thiamine pyrophosphate-binding protein n=1 Tax=Roseicyclus sediminis TaxID=2980997 RepID=UPI0021D1E593|nr:thiamine pyrophosphate-binding protein [Roseibacterium sp. SDUM158016]MCU4652661.1 thiamine pyrophosphate-binding protein [Roseibacterium sp. SDUM158016]
MPLTGAQSLVACLRQQGVDHCFLVPGESYLAVLDALTDAPEVAVTVCRQEGGAAMMADAYGKLTGRPGICMVTRGPGATNASAGLHVARQDATPMILFVGQVARHMREREAFQEVDYRRMFGQVAKWVAEVDSADRVPEMVSRAFHVAMSGRPGPVVLALPEDMLVEASSRVSPSLPLARPAIAGPTDHDLRRLQNLLANATAPMIVVGGGAWSDAARQELQAVAERWAVPVAASFRCQDFFDNTHPNYAGDVGIGINPKLAARIRSADVLVLLGTRFSEMESSGYSLIDIPKPAETLVHVYPDPEEIGRVYMPDLGIAAPAAETVAALARCDAPRQIPQARLAHVAACNADYRAWSSLPEGRGALAMAEVMGHVKKTLRADAIVTNGAGNYTVWVHRFLTYRRHRTQLAPISGSMGYGLPAAVAAARMYPDREVVCFAGDGCFLMHGQELATAAKYKVNLTVIVVNNGMYGTIRMHQERSYPGRVSATDLTNPDFAMLARAYGCHGETVTRTDQFVAAWDRALACAGPSLIELQVDPDLITPTQTIADLRRVSQRD